VNVSKGEVAKSGDLQNAFGKTDTGDIIKEVRTFHLPLPLRQDPSPF
jgi:ribosome maturation protein SDO1